MILSAKTYASYYDLQLLSFIGFKLLDGVSWMKSGFLPLDSSHTLLLELGILVYWSWHRTDKDFADFASFDAAIYVMLYYRCIYSTCIILVPCIIRGQKWFPLINMILFINAHRVRLVGPCLHTALPNLARNGDFCRGEWTQQYP